MSEYTANDFRETADDFENYADLDESVISAMLRQAADMIERAEGAIAANDESKNPGSVTRGPVQVTAMYILTGSTR